MVSLIMATSPLVQLAPVPFDKSILPSLTMVPAILISIADLAQLPLPSWLLPTPETPSLFNGGMLVTAMCVYILYAFVSLFFSIVFIIMIFKWPHNTGPIMTYLADCGSTTSDKCDSTNLKWFKIDQQGKQSNDSSLWVQETVSKLSSEFSLK